MCMSVCVCIHISGILEVINEYKYKQIKILSKRRMVITDSFFLPPPQLYSASPIDYLAPTIFATWNSFLIPASLRYIRRIISVKFKDEIEDCYQ